MPYRLRTVGCGKITNMQSSKHTEIVRDSGLHMPVSMRGETVVGTNRSCCQCYSRHRWLGFSMPSDYAQRVCVKLTLSSLVKSDVRRSKIGNCAFDLVGL